MEGFTQESLLDLFTFETTQLIEQLEQLIISSEKTNYLSDDTINEVFRIMHTIKGSSAMMSFNNITSLSHSIEDLFYYLREKKPYVDDYSKLADIVLKGSDLIKSEINRIVSGEGSECNPSIFISGIKNMLTQLKRAYCQKKDPEGTEVITSTDQPNSEADIILPSENSFQAVIYFEDGCEMENIRAFNVIHMLKSFVQVKQYFPENITDSDNSVNAIRKEGFKVFFSTKQTYDDIYQYFWKNIVYLKDLELTLIDNEHTDINVDPEKSNVPETEQKDNAKQNIPISEKETPSINTHQSIISVNVAKLDKLMDLVGELVISEAMVTQNQDLKGLNLSNFQKASRQLQKVTGELQDIVMSIRMVPLSTTFQKMNRIVRDMSRKLSKDVVLQIIGEETEVDKNIIDHISDPLMHLIRNAVDHGIETVDERKALGKLVAGTITLEAKNEGGDVVIYVKDDGRGLDKRKILDKARKNGLISRPEDELTDKEVFSYIFMPGFSTKDKVTEFSGRGVGMDVVTKNIGIIGGNVSVESKPGEGTVIILKIPLTLAIMDGMTIRVGKSMYTVPTVSIKESFKASDNDVITDPQGNEMIMIRGQCYSILRLHRVYKVKSDAESISDGIILMVENEGRSLCIFADELVGEQQVVVKALPKYINQARGLAGCTLLGDGSISLILNIPGLLQYQ